MSEVVSRRFGLGDGMIVIAGLAATLAVVRVDAPAFESLLNPPSGAVISYGMQFAGGTELEITSPALMFAINLGVLLLVLLGIWLLAFALMRLRPPRPSLRVVALEPGMIAVWVLVAESLAGGVVYRLIGGRAADIIVMAGMCLALPGAWLMLVVTDRWRSEPSWINRLGRMLAFCWWGVSWIDAALILAAAVRY